MPVVSVSRARKNLDAVLDEVQNTFEPVIIAGEHSSAVLISEEVWKSVEETLYIYSIPGMKESIVSGMALRAAKRAFFSGCSSKI